MNGNTLIKSLGTTVAKEAYSYVKSQAYIPFRDRTDKKMCISEIISETICTANLEKPSKVKDIIGIYLNEMSESSYTTLSNRIIRELK